MNSVEKEIRKKLDNYCGKENIELKNPKKVIDKIETMLNNIEEIIPAAIQQVGDVIRLNQNEIDKKRVDFSGTWFEEIENYTNEVSPQSEPIKIDLYSLDFDIFE